MNSETLFKRFLLTFFIAQVTMWVIPTLLPILLNSRYGVGKEFVISMGLQWLPSMFLGPFIGVVIDKFGAYKIYIITFLLSCILLLSIPLTREIWQLQTVILGLGITQAVTSPAALTLRAFIMKEGQEVSGNSKIIGIQRFSKIIGPLFAGFLISILPITGSFFICSLIGLISVALLWSLKTDFLYIEKFERVKDTRFRDMFIEFWKSISKDTIILGAVVSAIGYTITLGALRIVLFAYAEVLGNPEKTWTLFLIAQGVGAVVGAITCNRIVSKLMKRYSLVLIYVVVSIFEAVFLCMIGAGEAIIFTLGILVIASIFETFAFVGYFSLIQTRIKKEKQGLFNGITFPIINSFYLVGIFIAGLFISKLSLLIVLFISVSFTVISLFPFIFAFKISNRDNARGI